MPAVTDPATGQAAEVNSQRQLSVRAETESELEGASEEGQAYIWFSLNLDVAAADTILLVKNTSDVALHMDSCVVASGNVATRYTVHLPTSEVTVVAGANGAIVVGTNLNGESTNVADASAASDEEGNSQGNLIAEPSLLPTTTYEVDLTGVILGKNQSIAVDQVEESTAGSASLKGHYVVGE